MSPKIFWILDKHIVSGSLGTMVRPKGKEFLEKEMLSLKQQEVDTIVCLLGQEESKELGIEKEQQFCETMGIEFIRFPIIDMTVPENNQPYLDLLKEIIDRLTANKKVVIHCKMGIGRSSMIAGGVLIKLGVDKTEVFDLISKFRGLTVPDTKEQVEWVWKVMG